MLPFEIVFSYSSRRRHICFLLSYTSYSCMSLGCCSDFIISISLITELLSCSLTMETNLAASRRPVDFSRQRFTSPNLPLRNKSNRQNKIQLKKKELCLFFVETVNFKFHFIIKTLHS